MRFPQLLAAALALVACPAVAGEGIAVDRNLADLVEQAVRFTQLKINVPPRLMEAKSLQIDKIDGLDVCESTAKEKVLALQKAFAESAALKSTISTFGVYSRNASGKMVFVSGDVPEMRAQLGDCRYLYVSVQ